MRHTVNHQAWHEFHIDTPMPLKPYVQGCILSLLYVGRVFPHGAHVQTDQGLKTALWAKRKIAISTREAVGRWLFFGTSFHAANTSSLDGTLPVSLAQAALALAPHFVF